MSMSVPMNALAGGIAEQIRAMLRGPAGDSQQHDNDGTGAETH